jgi:hypothetical protein
VKLALTTPSPRYSIPITMLLGSITGSTTESSEHEETKNEKKRREIK